MEKEISPNTERGLSVFDLKCIAVASMLIDHIGAFLYPSEVWMRYVGRLAFPIYCFLIVEGFFHTRNVKKYFERLLLFAVISEIPYDLIRSGRLLDVDRQNVFFTLFFGLLCIWALAQLPNILLADIVVVIVMILMHYAVRSDYGIGGIVMILCFYLFRTQPAGLVLSVGAINVFCYGVIQRAGVLALVPIRFYNGTKGPSAKYFFYAFYPVHLILLYLCRMYL